jgi:uncharacterized membrane protein
VVSVQNAAEFRIHNLLIFQERRISLHVQPKALKQTLYIGQAVAASLDYFYFVIQSLDKPAIVPIDKIVCDFLHPIAKRLQKSVKAS